MTKRSFEMEKATPNSIFLRGRRKYFVIASFVLFVIFQIYIVCSPRLRVEMIDIKKAVKANKVVAQNENTSLLSSNTVLPDIYHCYHKKQSEQSIRFLKDLLTATKQPTLDKTIFFVISTCFKDDLIEIRKR